MIYKTLLGEEIDMEVEVWKPYKVYHMTRWGTSYILTDIEVSNYGNIRGNKWNGKDVEIHYDRDNRRTIGSEHVFHLVWCIFNGPILKGYDIHHVDLNKHNDRLDNLIMLTHSEHAQIHMKGRKVKNKTKKKLSNKYQGEGNPAFGRKWMKFKDKFKIYAKEDQIEKLLENGFEFGYDMKLKKLTYDEFLEYFN